MFGIPLQIGKKNRTSAMKKKLNLWTELSQTKQLADTFKNFQFLIFRRFWRIQRGPRQKF